MLFEWLLLDLDAGLYPMLTSFGGSMLVLWKELMFWLLLEVEESFWFRGWCWLIDEPYDWYEEQGGLIDIKGGQKNADVFV